jgi:CRP/FNR family transcriptional regulator, cyclic AMP receptor protein
MSEYEGGLTKQDLIDIEEMGEVREIEADQLLFEPGSPSDHVMWIRTGSVQVHNHRMYEDVILAHLGPGEILGEVSYLDQHSPSAEVRAVEPTTVLAVPVESLAARAGDDPAFASRLHLSIAVKLAGRLRQVLKLT